MSDNDNTARAMFYEPRPTPGELLALEANLERLRLEIERMRPRVKDMALHINLTRLVVDCTNVERTLIGMRHNKAVTIASKTLKAIGFNTGTFADSNDVESLAYLAGLHADNQKAMIEAQRGQLEKLEAKLRDARRRRRTSKKK